MAGHGEASHIQDPCGRHEGSTHKCEASNARMLQPALKVGCLGFFFTCLF